MKKTIKSATKRVAPQTRTAAPKPKDVVVESDSTIQRTRPEDRVDLPNTDQEATPLPSLPDPEPVEDGAIPRSAPNHPDRHKD